MKPASLPVESSSSRTLNASSVLARESLEVGAEQAQLVQEMPRPVPGRRGRR
jgi:hypothetical protein